MVKITTSIAALLVLQNATAQRHRQRPSARGQRSSQVQAQDGQSLRGISEPSPSSSPIKTDSPTGASSVSTPHPTYLSSSQFPTTYFPTASEWKDDDLGFGSGQGDDDFVAGDASSAYGALSSMANNDGHCSDEYGQQKLFQLELQTDDAACETSWLLERIISNKDGSETALYVDGHENGDYFDTSSYAASKTLCLGEGRYQFTIFDAFGDGFEAPGYYMVALDGVVLAGSSNFGYQEMTPFTVTTTEAVDVAVEEQATDNSETGCSEHGQSTFQLDLRINCQAHETSWILEQITISEYGEDVLEYVDGHGIDYFDSSYLGASQRISKTICLSEGQYRFTMQDEYGDGFEAPGYYMISLDDDVLVRSSEFGFQDVTQFDVHMKTKAVGYMSVDQVENVEVQMPASASEDGVLVDQVQVEDNPILPERLSGIINMALASERPSSKTPTRAPSSAASTPREPVSEVQTQAVAGVLTDTKEFSRPATVTATPQASTQTTSSAWVEILKDDFEKDPGIFHSSNSDNQYSTYYPFVMDRRGVIRLQNDHPSSSSSIHSRRIAIDASSSFSEIKVNFSYYANSMEVDNNHHDGFCLDYSVDDGKSWHSKKCWHVEEDFGNGVWYDDTAVTFNMMWDNHDHDRDINVKDIMVDGLRIRFRCKTNSLHDDVLIDRIQLMGLVETTELEDSS